MNMKKIFKRIIVICLVICLISVGKNSVCANSNIATINKTDSNKEKVSLDKIDEIENKDKIVIDNKEYLLYKTFKNSNKALENIKLEIPEFLGKLANKYNLEQLNDSNWIEYQNCLNQYMNDNPEVEESSKEYRLLSCFFDIYENKEKNKYILDYYKENNGNLKVNDKKLALLLPYTSEISQNFNETELNSLMSIQTYNLNEAINYAINYAEIPNNYYRVYSSDCTNFVSQILDAAGVSQEVYDSVYSGWWYKINYVLGVEVHTNSNSWSVADTFCRYMGVGYTTKNHYNFSANTQQGDFIAYDRYSDGDWNHCGFIAYHDSYASTYNGKYYYDYMVAQHTNNYIAWVSTSQSGWENIEDEAGTYARIRR